MVKELKSDAPLDGSHNTASANDLVGRHTDDEASDEGEERTLEADEENTPTTDGGTRAARQEARCVQYIHVKLWQLVRFRVLHEKWGRGGYTRGYACRRVIDR